MSLLIEKYDHCNQAEWDRFLNTCKNKHFMFNREFMDYHSDRFTDHSLIVRDEKQKILALLPANVQNNTLYSHQGLTFGGLLTNEKTTTVIMVKIFTKIVSYLKNNNITKFIYKCIPSIYCSLPAQEDLYALFINDAQLIRRDVSSSIDLNNRVAYSKGRKWGINRAKKNNVCIAKFERVGDAWPLINDVLKKHYDTSPTHTEKEINLLHTRFPENISAYYAHVDNRVIAVAVFFDTDLVSHTQYLAVNDEGREVSALDYLIDHVIQDKIGKSTYFDFGISNEDSGKFLNEGLIAQKEGFGARAIVHDFYEIKIQ